MGETQLQLYVALRIQHGYIVLFGGPVEPREGGELGELVVLIVASPFKRDLSAAVDAESLLPVDLIQDPCKDDVLLDF